MLVLRPFFKPKFVSDDDDDYDDDFYDSVDFEGGREERIDLDISKIVDIFSSGKLVEKEADVLSFSDDSILQGIESDRDSGEDTTSIDDLPLDDSMIFPEYESFTFDDEPVMAEVNVFDEINTSELSYPGIGENVVLDEEEDTFTFTIRSFLPFVTYPEVLPTSYSTGSEDKIFNPGILDVFNPLHPPLMDFHDTKAFSGFSDLEAYGSKLWKDKAIPTSSIDGLQSSLHKMGNLLSLVSLSN
ncbi:hypothetical protein Tco_0097620 [Tanacetum coccineum]